MWTASYSTVTLQYNNSYIQYALIFYVFYCQLQNKVSILISLCCAAKQNDAVMQVILHVCFFCQRFFVCGVYYILC